MASEASALAEKARRAAIDLASSTNEQRCTALRLFRDELKVHQTSIESANEKDIADLKAKGDNTNSALLKRLDCSSKKLTSCLKGIDELLEIKDPLGNCTLATELSEGLRLYRVTCPIGVIAVIFEARPEAAIQIASLAIRSGNALILKGGKEAKTTNHAIFAALKSALRKSQLPEDAVVMIDTREDVVELLGMHHLIDLVIPRGSKDLVKFVKEKTKIPVLGHADGLCIGYVDEVLSDIDMAVNVIVDSKTNYPAACNALETLLVHEQIANEFLPRLAKAFEPFNLTFHADVGAQSYLPADKTVPANPDDYETEYLTLDLCVKLVKSVREAIQHINRYGSHHTDLIITQDQLHADQFLNQVDSASVFYNCSTRFADGFRFGFGAEVGISTNKIHSRGPVGLEGLLIYKYKLFGKGQTVGAGVCGTTTKSTEFTHKKLSIPTGPIDAHLVLESL